MNDFFGRFTGPNCQDSKYNDPIKKQTILRFKDMSGKEKSQSNTITEDESESFGTILAIYDSLKLDLNFLMNWPVTTRTWSICSRVFGRHGTVVKGVEHISTIVLVNI